MRETYFITKWCGMHFLLMHNYTISIIISTNKDLHVDLSSVAAYRFVDVSGCGRGLAELRPLKCLEFGFVNYASLQVSKILNNIQHLPYYIKKNLLA